MSLFIKHYRPASIGNCFCVKIWRFSSTAAGINVKGEEEEEFRVLDLNTRRQRLQKKIHRRADVQPDRADRMAPDQNWGNVWPGPKTFHPSAVPLPIRQGYALRGQAPPGKKANAELMKIPNFLHLTPPVVKTQCEALMQFCTEWPQLLNSEEAIEKHYPLEIITSDYCHASPSIRNPLARIVALRTKLKGLKLDPHARDKFLRLVGNRYDEETDLLTITADRCPVRKQNLDYVNYLLTACYHESWNYEDWETDKTEDDMEYYNFEKNNSKKVLVEWFERVSGDKIENLQEFDVGAVPNGQDYKEAVSSLFNDGEGGVTVEKYGEAVRKLLGLPAKKN